MLRVWFIQLGLRNAFSTGRRIYDFENYSMASQSSPDKEIPNEFCSIRYLQTYRA